ncbi:histidine kinase [Amycolatopsis sp. NEAU-NG30]|uniref:histidine kinase n=1 Tax=Amycolatopsis melonis TaxID=3156488 RepID=A0ABV0LC50_9PSEU
MPERLEKSLAQSEITLPWWVAVGANGVSATLILVAAGQRASVTPPALLVLAVLLTLSTSLAWLVTGRIVAAWIKGVTVAAAVALLLGEPRVPDFAPIVLVVVAAEMASIARPALALGLAVLDVAVLCWAAAGPGLTGLAVYLAAVLLGLSGGFMLRWYVRALAAERAGQASAREQAILDERRRIAREVHDVAAHSLAVTMLHLTGARHALQQDRDVDDAIEGLTEAERIGRVAMADIRRTVGLLSHAPADRHALPGADDIAGLAEHTRSAGLDVRFEQSGDPGRVAAVAGLALYRITQESLANVVKHAPRSTARIRLDVGAGGVRLTVRNALPAPVAGPAHGGSGLTGMAARAEQLGAELRTGPDGGDWVVDVTVPSAVAGPARAVLP